MSTSSHRRSKGSSSLAMRIAASGLKLKLRSRLMSTEAPTASLKVPIWVTMWSSSLRSMSWSVVPGPPPNPGKCSEAGSPGKTMFVLSAVYPRATTSLPRSARSSKERIGGVPSSSGCMARVLPQCDQYSRTSSRMGPPNISTTEMPSAFAFRSSSAFSTPAMALAAIPPKALARAAHHVPKAHLERAGIGPDQQVVHVADGSDHTVRRASVRAFPVADQAIVGLDLHKDPGPPSRVDDERFYVGDLHAHLGGAVGSADCISGTVRGRPDVTLPPPAAGGAHGAPARTAMQQDESGKDMRERDRADRLSRCYSGAVYDAMRELGLPPSVLPSSIGPIDPAKVLAGPVWTCEGPHRRGSRGRRQPAGLDPAAQRGSRRIGSPSASPMIRPSPTWASSPQRLS